MKFTKYSITTLITFAALSCFGANYQTEVNSILSDYKNAPQEGKLDKPAAEFAARQKIFVLAATVGDPKNKDSNKERTELGKALANALKNTKDKEEKIFLSNVLWLVGGDESIVVLEGLLKDKDKDIADAARMALEKSLSPKASKTLEGALGAQKDPALMAGLVQGIADRKDSPALIENAKKSNDPLVVGATYIEKRDWPESEYAAFYTEFTEAPSKQLVANAIANKDSERPFILVAPAVFTVTKDLMPQFKSRFEKSEGPTKAWILTRLAGVDGAKSFIIKYGTDEAQQKEVKMAAVNALTSFPDADSVKAILQIMKAGDGEIRFWSENAIAGMSDPKTDAKVDATLIAEAKNNNADAIRILGKRGIFPSIPMLLDNVKNNKERGASFDALMMLADDDAYLAFAKMAADSKDDDLLRRLVNLSTNLAKRAKNHDNVTAKLAAMSKSSKDDTVKSAFERASEVIAKRGVVEKR